MDAFEIHPESKPAGPKDSSGEKREVHGLGRSHSMAGSAQHISQGNQKESNSIIYK